VWCTVQEVLVSYFYSIDGKHLIRLRLARPRNPDQRTTLTNYMFAKWPHPRPHQFFVFEHNKTRPPISPRMCALEDRTKSSLTLWHSVCGVTRLWICNLSRAHMHSPILERVACVSPPHEATSGLPTHQCIRCLSLGP
jgi:hypothetical protein